MPEADLMAFYCAYRASRASRGASCLSGVPYSVHPIGAVYMCERVCVSARV